MQDLIVLALIVAAWWLPTLRVIREMDLLPGLPRPLFWSVLPIIGLPVIGPLAYVLWLRFPAPPNHHSFSNCVRFINL